MSEKADNCSGAGDEEVVVDGVARDVVASDPCERSGWDDKRAHKATEAVGYSDRVLAEETFGDDGLEDRDHSFARCDKKPRVDVELVGRG